MKLKETVEYDCYCRDKDSGAVTKHSIFLAGKVAPIFAEHIHTLADGEDRILVRVNNEAATCTGWARLPVSTFLSEQNYTSKFVTSPEFSDKKVAIKDRSLKLTMLAVSFYLFIVTMHFPTGRSNTPKSEEKDQVLSRTVGQ